MGVTNPPHAPTLSTMKPQPLPIPGRYQIRPLILRAYRSKYAPHVGKKQLAKANARKP